MEAGYFDGRSSRRQTVQLEAEPGQLILRGPDGEERIPLADLEISEPHGSAPRTLRFNEERYCEVRQGAELDALLQQLGHQHSRVVSLQGSWRWSLASLTGVILLLAALYQWGLPWGARTLAPLIPESAVQQLSRQTLKALDEAMLRPSQLSAQEQQRLQQGFQTLVAADPGLAPFKNSLQLHFRSAPRVGPNAFALPDGQIVLLDELVEMPANEAEIQAILAHELGHVRHRHGLTQLIQSSVVAGITAAYLGDLSSLAAGLSSLLITSSYSRDMERQADDYAAATLRQLGYSPAALGSALAKLSRAHGEENETGKDWLASHPDTRERIQRLGGQP